MIIFAFIFAIFVKSEMEVEENGSGAEMENGPENGTGTEILDRRLWITVREPERKCPQESDFKFQNFNFSKHCGCG